MKVTNPELEALVELFGLQGQLAKLKRELAEVASGAALASAQEEILELAQEVSNQRSQVEEMDRELARVAGDLALVEKRIATDKERLNQSSNPKDIGGIQHELDALSRRKDELETAELELMESIDEQRSALEQLLERRRVLDGKLEDAKAASRETIALLQGQILEVTNHVERLRSSAPQDVLRIFDQRALRGVPIGKLLKSTCGACNMSLTSTALNDLHKIPADELARCPECTAILVRS